MLQNLDYIYKAMYALDMWDKLNNLLTTYMWVFPVITCIGWIITLFVSSVKSKVGEDQVNKLVEATRKQVVDSLMATMKK